jgi:pimeloyl-ACP methyl ester carboxylesterase
MIDTTRAGAAAFRVTLGLSLALALSGCAQATADARPESAQAPAAEGTSKPAEGAPAAAADKEAASKEAAAKKARFANSADGTRIAYDVTGSGPALILLHGGGQTRTSWNERGYVEPLAKQYTVITMDLRGYGESGKPDTAEAYALDRVLEDIVAVADAAGATRFHLWGFGHGATIGRYLAARSDRVISAVLVAANMGEPITGIVKDAILGMRAKWQPLLEAQKAGTLDLKGLSPGDRSAWDGGIAISALSLGAMVEYPPLEPSEIKVPTLWLVGSADTNAMENVKEYEGKLAGTMVTLKQISGASYSDSFARSEPTLAEVRPFLAAQTGS